MVVARTITILRNHSLVIELRMAKRWKIDQTLG